MNNSIDRENLDPSDPYVRENQTFPTLTLEQVERTKSFGEVQMCSKGMVLFEHGDRSVDFFVVLSGSIEIYEHRRDGINVFTIHGKHQFTGEIDLFNNRKILVGGRLGEDRSIIRVNRENFRKMITADPEIGEIVIRAFILRRVGLITYKQGSVSLLCEKKTLDSIRIERFLHMVTSVDCSKHPYTISLCNKGELKTRSIVIATGAKYQSLLLENCHEFDNAGIYCGYSYGGRNL